MSKRRAKSDKGALKRAAKWLKIILLGFVVISITSVLLLRYLPPPASALMLIRVASAKRHFDARSSKQWVPFEKISCNMIQAAMAAEDQRFLEHDGFDFGAMRDAFEHNRHHRRIRGGSTISQQTAKNLFLWPGRSYLRKGLEAYFTVLIELLWSKQRILEIYLNIVEMGHGIFGVEKAAMRYFKKSSAKLTQDEAALLAATLPSPLTRDPSHPSVALLRKKGWVVEQMKSMDDSLCP